jgi:hypothetical protein
VGMVGVDWIGEGSVWFDVAGWLLCSGVPL